MTEGVGDRAFGLNPHLVIIPQHREESAGGEPGLRGGWRDYCIVNAPERSGLGAGVERASPPRHVVVRKLHAALDVRRVVADAVVSGFLGNTRPGAPAGAQPRIHECMLESEDVAVLRVSR